MAHKETRDDRARSSGFLECLGDVDYSVPINIIFMPDGGWRQAARRKLAMEILGVDMRAVWANRSDANDENIIIMIVEPCKPADGYSHGNLRAAKTMTMTSEVWKNRPIRNAIMMAMAAEYKDGNDGIDS